MSTGSSYVWNGNQFLSREGELSPPLLYDALSRSWLTGWRSGGTTLHGGRLRMSDSDSSGVFSDHERATIEAAAARIVPADQDAGAREAGVIDYIEGLLASDEDEMGTDVSPREKKEYANFLLGSMGGRTEEQQATLFKLNGLGSRHRHAYCDGVVELDRLAGELRPGTDFCGLDDEGQDQVLTVLDERKDPFFTLLLTHTMEGFYGHPRHGGNKDSVGWQMLGYPGPSFPHGNEQPYGWYDANEPDEFPHAKKDRSS